MTPDDRVLLVGLVTLIHALLIDDARRITPMHVRPPRAQRNAARHVIERRERYARKGIHLAT